VRWHQTTADKENSGKAESSIHESHELIGVPFTSACPGRGAASISASKTGATSAAPLSLIPLDRGKEAGRCAFATNRHNGIQVNATGGVTAERILCSNRDFISQALKIRSVMLDVQAQLWDAIVCELLAGSVHYV
jgi:hypothetical protein